ncbi:MAG TPA: hypothetical protein VF796_11535 [Humisphaera sp.]
MNRRQFLAATAAAAVASVARSPVRGGDAPATAPASTGPAGELLYNGIRLPAQWPPKLAGPLDASVPPPYLASPPAVVPIDLGRQLFVDDFLIESTTLVRTFHRPTPHPGNPILKPDQPWERAGKAPMAMAFSDGVWFDPGDRLFKMWYMGGYGRAVCLALSHDGITWEKPKLDVVEKGTNIVHPGPRDSATVWLDHAANDPAKRFVLFRSHGENKRFAQSVHFSPDGIRWGERAVRSGSTGDRTTAFYNPFRKVWVYSNRHGWGVPRRRRYWETRDLVAGPQWNEITEPTMWLEADKLDPERADLKTPPQLYNLDCVAYESIVLGLFTIWRGDLNIPPGRPKPNNVCAGFSRDGFHFTRPDRSAFIDVSERPGDWNWGNVQSAGGCCLIVGDELYFYHSGRAGSPAVDGKAASGAARDGGGSTGLAVMRRDGFASMDAPPAGGTLTTRPVRFTGGHLFVNATVPPGGGLTAEVIGDDGKPLPGLTAAQCVPVTGDKAKLPVVWKAGTIAAAAGKPVRLRFHLSGGSRVYAFWVAKEKGGASGGFVAAGGPGLTDRDA